MTSREFYQKVLEAIKDSRVAYTATLIESAGSTPRKPGTKILIYGDGSFCGTIGGGDLEKKLIDHVIHSAPRTPALVDFNLNEEEHRPSDPKMSCGGRVRILVEPLANPHQLCIVGGGHCGSELSRLAASVGYSVTVIDNRETWAGRDKHPAASRVICAPYDEIEHHIPFSNEICIAVMTHGHAHDEEIARRCLKHEFRYLGVIGSSRKAAGLFKRLREDGFDEHQLSRLHCPIGLPIPSHTPAEIAVSIVAQLLTIREEPAGGTALDSPPNPA